MKTQILKGKVTYIGAVLGLIFGVCKIWDIEIDPRIVETIGYIGGSTVLVGIKRQLKRLEDK